MGCWNETCHLSNLPIQCGDEVVVIVYAESYGFEYGSKIGYYNYYPNSLYSPFLPPIYGGKYNDYGGIEGDNLEESNKIVMDCIKNFKFIHDEKEIKFKSIEKFISSIERSSCGSKEGIFIRRINSKHRVRFSMYHADIYRNLVEAWNEGKDREEKKETVRKCFNSDRIFSITRGGIPYVEDFISYYLFSDLQKSDEFISRIIDISDFTYILGCLRKGYSCITGHGSQNTDLELHFFLNNLIRKHILEKMKTSLKDYCDDEEFDNKYDLENNPITDEIVIEYLEKHKTDIL